MGKERRLRQKYHLAAVKAKSEEKKVKFAIDVDDKPQVGTAARQSNIFSGLDINLNDLVKSLPGNSGVVEEEITPAGSQERIERLRLKNTNMSKKEKIKLRHLAFLQKIQVVQESRKKVKATKQRQKTAIIRDMQPLLDSLPTTTNAEVPETRPTSAEPKGATTVSSASKMLKILSTLTESKPVAKDSKAAPKKVVLELNSTKKKGPKAKSHKQLQKQMLSDMEIFRQVKDHPEFKRKPEATILKHLHNKIKYCKT